MTKISKPAKQTILHLTVEQLHPSERNVRKTPSSAASDAEISASLLSVGLIQPMVVIDREGGGYEVIAGNRRRRLLTALAEADPSRKALTFLCMKVDDLSKVTEISMAENRAREAMSLPDVYRGFAAIRAERPEATLEELGAMFGYDVARTARIMRIANLHPEIMDLYSAGEISDAQAMAYAATEDQSLQIAVYRQLEEQATYDHHKNASAIRKAMNSGDHELSKLIRYVGIEAYREAGGVFEADLFAKEGEGIVQNSDLLRDLAAKRMADDKDRFAHKIVRNGRMLGEKWGLADLQFSWAASPPQIKQHGYVSTDRELRFRPELGDLPKDLAGIYASMEARLVDMIDEDDEPLPDQEEAYEMLFAEMRALDGGRPIILPKKGAIVGVASIENDGRFEVELWFADRAAKGAEIPKGATQQRGPKAELSPAEAERARFGLSKENMQVMMLIRRDMIRAELTQSAVAGSSLALDFMLFTQARTILMPTLAYGNTVYFHGEDQGINDLPHDEDGTSKIAELVKGRPERAAWLTTKEDMASATWRTAHDPIEGFALFRQLSDLDKNKVAALVASHMLMATTSAYSEGRTPRMVCELANIIESEPSFGRWRDAVVLDEAFFAKLSHKARIALLDTWGLADRAKGMKASETAAFCARIANCDEEDAKLLGLHPDDIAEAVNWLPDFMETGTIPPLPVKIDEPEAFDDAEDADQLEELDEAA
ncbi:ParB-like chromosome segregation protein Spo0J [Sphingobium sp. B2D3A]|uniref:ParB/RepB/Spo0J family partition protein n=1 Tax=unclassified Sphingobium TaxID=2611147 RepID=UPI0022254AF9|nr:MULTISPECIES: ParB/RepB/Spo0J family partition protein [unclassified Sphingobium]MCW2339107.1 ParB-like chromosome segregation protein Spo0J [Sphingobium sp. B2D3A]MCW2386950.1 ParB-like chromosome segregation protein Spo0J [Sphingobium sp. B2D3D]